MRNVLVVIVLAVLATACGKKQAPASPKPPIEEKATEGDAKEPAAAPAPGTAADPCEGGENK